jgi:hypothetical protein
MLSKALQFVLYFFKFLSVVMVIVSISFWHHIHTYVCCQMQIIKQFTFLCSEQKGCALRLLQQKEFPRKFHRE